MPSFFSFFWSKICIILLKCLIQKVLGTATKLSQDSSSLVGWFPGKFMTCYHIHSWKTYNITVFTCNVLSIHWMSMCTVPGRAQSMVNRDNAGVQAWKNPSSLMLLSCNWCLLPSVIPYLMTWNRMQLCCSSLWHLLVRERNGDLGWFGWNSEVTWSIKAWPEVPDQIGAARSRLACISTHAHRGSDVGWKGCVVVFLIISLRAAIMLLLSASELTST